ncbi:hypothetical protein [Peterkaempfera sp. SMS 1(5)a]|uniref:hypothetical protein n=1 Tax=Peterkaempfera podocarpi TaxID=3232308 RepID=UPI0036712274
MNDAAMSAAEGEAGGQGAEQEPERSLRDCSTRGREGREGEQCADSGTDHRTFHHMRPEALDGYQQESVRDPQADVTRQAAHQKVK